MKNLNDLSGKKIGDVAYGVDGSEWIVRSVTYSPAYPLLLEHTDCTREETVTLDGQTSTGCPPTFFAEPVQVISAQGECDFSGYEVGDVVYLEDGFASEVDREQYGVFYTGMYAFDRSGKNSAEKQIAFHAPPHMVPSNPDAFKVPAHIAERSTAVGWSQVPIDTLVEICAGNDIWTKRYFAGVRDGQPAVYRFGATSITAPTGSWTTVLLSQIRLAK